MIEVQRARVRALCARLMQRPAGFNLNDTCHCSVAEAGRMAEFALVGAHSASEGYGLLGDTTFLSVAPEFFGLNREYFGLPASDEGCPPPDSMWSYKIHDKPYRIALFYLEAIGDCGPQKPKDAIRAAQMNHLAAADIPMDKLNFSRADRTIRDGAEFHAVGIETMLMGRSAS